MKIIIIRLLPLVLIAALFLQINTLSCGVIRQTGVTLDPEYKIREGDNTSYHGENDIIIGLEGTYATVDEEAKQIILNRLNEIRKEACDNGYPHPYDRSVKLTPDDYVPIKWSNVVEQIAAMRAAEASVCIGHQRLSADENSVFFNGYGFFTWAEILAWNWSDANTKGILFGIDQFYSEKEDWLNDTGAVTGHYTSIILPYHTHIGIAGFRNEYASFRLSVAAQFGMEGDIDETPAGVGGKVYQKVKAERGLVTSLTLRCKNVIATGETVSATAEADIVKYSLGYASSGHGPVFSGLKWKSSDPLVLSVDSYGNVKGLNAGKATLTASVNERISASVDVVVEAEGSHDLIHHGYNEPTHYEPGNVEYWECNNCGKLFSDADGQNEISIEDVTIPIIPHDLIWVRSASGHKQVCECGYETEYQNHVYYAGSDVCVICGYDCGAAGLRGDVNKDGEENNKDVVVLFRYVSAGGNEPEYDFSGDGEVNNKDVVSLFRYISE